MIKKITNNFWWKIFSVFLASLTWLMIVNTEDPQISRTFYDVQVEKLNIEAIESEKKAIEYREGETVNVRIRGKRSIVDNMSISDIQAYADLEKKSITDAVDIVVEVPENISVVEKEPNMMMVELENIITVQKGVQSYMEGEPREGYVYLDPIVIPNNLEIEGPESKIGLIKSVLVPVNIEDVTRDVTLYGSPQIIDDSNNVINGLSMSATQIKIQVPIEKLKIVELKLDIDETIAPGYRLLGLSLSQNALQVRGKEVTVDYLDAITISGLDLKPLVQDTILNVNVSTILPNGINVYEDVIAIQVYVDIEPIVEKTINISNGDINVRHLAEDLQFSYVDEESYSITYRGIEDDLSKVDIESVSPSISLRGIEEGIQEIELYYFVPLGVEVISEKPTVTVELTKVVDEIDEDTEEVEVEEETDTEN